MADEINYIRKALTEALNNSPLPALRPLAKIKYLRECQVKQLSDNCFTVSFALWGHQYKYRGPKPKQKPTLNLSGIQQAFQAALPQGYKLYNVEDLETAIKLYIRKEDATS
jgi:hypothetical protein